MSNLLSGSTCQWRQWRQWRQAGSGGGGGATGVSNASADSARWNEPGVLGRWMPLQSPLSALRALGRVQRQQGCVAPSVATLNVLLSAQRLRKESDKGGQYACPGLSSGQRLNVFCAEYYSLRTFLTAFRRQGNSSRHACTPRRGCCGSGSTQQRDEPCAVPG